MGTDSGAQGSIFGGASLVSAPAPAPASGASLLGGPAPAFGRPAAQQPRPAQSGSVNLLDLDFSSPSPAPSSDASSFGLLDPNIFGDLTGLSGGPSQQGGSSFGFLGGGGSFDSGLQFASQLTRSSDFSLDNLQKIPAITEKILNRRVSAQQVVNTQQLVVSWCKVCREVGGRKGGEGRRRGGERRRGREERGERRREEERGG
jgi:hypothetical protein